MSDPDLHADPVSPGDVIQCQFMDGWNMDEPQMAKFLEIDPDVFSRILSGTFRLTPLLCGRLSQKLGMLPGFWLALQRAYDHELAQRVHMCL